MQTLCLLLVVLVGCKKPEAEGTASPAPATSAPNPAAAPEPSAAQHPAPAATPAPQGGVELGPAQAGGLRWSDGDGLIRRAPKSGMRAAEYGVEGEPQAELTVFYFGEGQGGAVEPNIARWIGQFTQPDGSDTAKKAKRSEIKVQDLPVALVEATGSYGGGMGMPGMPAAAAISDAMLLGAIASGPKGPVFFKLTGPRAAVLKVRPGFDAMIQSLRPE